MSILDADQAQLSAITHVSGPMLVIAGPGSGKTFVITERIRYLIEEADVAPSDILVITFSSAAAKEMQERYQEQIVGQYAPVNFGTFHAVFFHILQHTFKYRAQSILKREEKINFLREIIEEKQYQITNENEWMQDMLSFISRQKMQLPDVKSAKQADEIRDSIYFAYRERCELEQRIDFDDMMINCLELFRTREDVLKEWRNRYRYILIDEFQDIAPVQYEVMKLLAGEDGNLFVVGDDDQSIYGFRGASPAIMKQFEREYPKLRKVILNHNYRSTQEIVSDSEQMVSHNGGRFVKQMKAVRKGGSGSVIIRKSEDHETELTDLLNELQTLSKTYRYEDMAVLYRTGYTGSELAERMMMASIPFTSREQMMNPYRHMVAQDVIAYLNMIIGDTSRKNFYRIMNKPTRYISRASISGEQVDFGHLYEFYRDKAYVTEAIMKLRYDLRFMKNQEPYGILQYLAKGVGYEKYLIGYAEEHGQEAEPLLEVFEQLKEQAKAFSTIQEWLQHIDAYGQKLKESQPAVQNGVMLSTIHAAKGLEYEIVLILDAYEGNLPHSRATLKEEIEEERRIFYVAMTRAKKALYIYYPKKYRGKEVRCSRFIREIDRPRTVLYNKNRKN